MHRHFDRPRLVVFGLIAAIGVAVATGSLTAADDRIDATGGAINIRPLAHASVQIEHAGKVIQSIRGCAPGSTPPSPPI